MAVRNAPAGTPDFDTLRERALNLRRLMLEMASGKGQGYIGQVLGIADLLAVLYFHEMRYDPANTAWSDRDRFLLSTGHYSMALWATLMEAGMMSRDRTADYGMDGAGLEMSTLDDKPGVEIVGGSLGHGLGQAIGMALGCRLDRRDSRIFCELSDGEMQEGSTWESAMAAPHFKLDRLVALIDCNGIQADGRLVMGIEPVREKWAAFGWAAQEIDGNDHRALVAALEAARAVDGKPKAIVLRTKLGKGVPTLESREPQHFLRTEDSEWATFRAELEARHG
jgi:transketolase